MKKAAGGKFRTEQKIKNNCLEQKSREGVILCFANDQKIDGIKVCDNCISDVKQIQINKTKLQLSQRLQTLLDQNQIQLLDAKNMLEEFECLIEQLVCLKELEITEDEEEVFDAATFTTICAILQKLNLVSNLELPIFQNQDIQKIQFERMILSHLEEMPLTKFHLNMRNNKNIAQQGLKEIANILKNQKKIQSIDLNFVNNLSFQDQQLIDLAEAIHKKNEMKHISLNFHKNDNFTDISIQKLSDSLAEYTKVEKLKLDFHYNTLITDKSFYNLTSAMNRMKQIQELSLNFCKNVNFSDDSLANLSRILITKPKITFLYLNFNYNENFQAQSLTDLGVSIGQMAGLKTLILQLERSKNFDDESIVDLFTGIKRQVQLKSIQFNLRQNNNLQKASLREMVSCFSGLKKLREFTLYINYYIFYLPNSNGYYKDVQDFLSRYPDDENREDTEEENS